MFIGYATAQAGRERQALAVYGELMQYPGGLQQRGQFQANPEFHSIVNRGLIVVRSLGIVNAAINEGVQRIFADFVSHLDELAPSH